MDSRSSPASTVSALTALTMLALGLVVALASSHGKLRHVEALLDLHGHSTTLPTVSPTDTIADLDEPESPTGAHVPAIAGQQNNSWTGSSCVVLAALDAGPQPGAAALWLSAPKTSPPRADI